MALIFIAIPSKGTVKDSKLTEEFLADLATLHLKYPEHTFVAPMVQDYQLLRHMPALNATWQDWGKHCRLLIERCDAVWIMKYEGWDTSVGVEGELQHAQKFLKTINFVEPKYL